ncbi:MAG: CpsD/CapB family tyrosine-protein kinase [Proteobacteria bacterium]|nr:CpsD/CapB family tyrosine-protein kinase [Pseudomonadota bacterium]
MSDQKLFGSQSKTIADAARTLDRQQGSGTNKLSVDHAVFADARNTVSDQDSSKTKPRAPSYHHRAASPHIVRGTDAAATVTLPALEERKSADSPMVRVNEAPEVSLTQHSLPEDRPLDPRLVLLAEPDSERAARFRILRHHLMDRGRPQVVVISSPKQGEGKTTCAVNLALALAECDRARVLLVEASVRRPQLAAVFRFVPPWCFGEQLSAHRHQPLLPWGVVDIPEACLHVAAINPQIEQSQLLDAPAFAIAMERLRLASYDHIVIDAPAVLGSAEVNLIQDAADGVLLTAWAKHTTARTLRTTVEQLSPTKIIGTVLMEF